MMHKKWKENVVLVFFLERGKMFDNYKGQAL